MAFRARKSVKLGPGVRLNASKTGLGVSVGGKGFTHSRHSAGRKTTSVGIPGSGVGYTKSSATRSRAAKPAPAPAPAAPPKPGLMAPAHEKAFYKGVQLYLAGDAQKALPQFMDAAVKDAKDKSVSDDFFAGLLSAELGKVEQAVTYFERVVRSDVELPDDLMRKYVASGAVNLRVTPHVQVAVSFGSTAATLSLVELYQALGRDDEAIALLLQLLEVEKSPAIVLSLAELLRNAGSWDEVIELAAGTKNEDDATLAVCVFQAEALERKGMDDAALEVYRDALRSKKRADELLKRARYGRGKLCLKLGKKAQGKKDLGRVYADEPGYLDVAQLLQAAE